MSMSAKTEISVAIPADGPPRPRADSEETGGPGPAARAGMAAAGFAALCALGECGGSLSHEAYRLAGLMLLAIVWLAHLRWPAHGRGWAWLVGGIALTIPAVWCVTLGPAAALLGAVLIAISLGMLTRADGRSESESPIAIPLAATALVMAAYFLLTKRISPLWNAANTASEYASCFMGALTGLPVRMRATYFALPVLLGSMVWTATWLGALPMPRREENARWRGRAVRIGLVLALVLLLQVVYVRSSATIMHGDLRVGDAAFNIQQSTAKAAQEAWGNNMGDPKTTETRDREVSKLWRMTFLHRTLPWNLPMLAVAIQVLLITVLAAMAASKPDLLGAWFFHPRAVAWTGAAAGVILLTVAIAPTGVGIVPDVGVRGVSGAKLAPDEGSHKVVFYNRGLLNWGRPRHGDYGSRSTGMFGLLYDLLESESITWDQVNRIDTNTLADADTMVFINLDEPLTSAERSIVWDFVYRGGRLLVLGDHTMQHDRGRTAAKLLERYRQLSDPKNAVQFVRRSATDALLDMGPTAGQEIRDRLKNSHSATDRGQLEYVLVELNHRFGKLDRKPGEAAGWLPPLAKCRREFIDRLLRILRVPQAEVRAQTKHTLEQLRQIGPTAVEPIRKIEEKLPDGKAKLDLAELRKKLAKRKTNPTFHCNFTNDLLGKESGIQFSFDSADFAVGGWLHGLEYADHPATAGMLDRRTEPGHVVGASLNIRWPARPLLIGKHGYADIGDYGAEHRAHMGTYDFEAIEPLGDLPLAAWAPFGDGQVYVFADTSGFANPIATSSHAFVTRMFGLLTYQRASPNDRWVAVALGLLIVSAVILAAWGRRLSVLGVSAIVLLIFGGAINVPQDDAFRRPKGNHIAYVDTSHLPLAAGEGWRPDGLMGLHLNLTRAGYYSMNFMRWQPKRLADAGLLVSTAPAKAYSPEEIKDIYRFVENGGRFILTVGGEHVEPVRSLLERFGMKVGEEGAMGYFMLPTLNHGGEGPVVMFYEAWPVMPIEKKDRIALIEWIEQRKLDKNGNYVIGPNGTRLRYPLGQPLKQPATDFELIAHYHTRPFGDEAEAVKNTPEGKKRYNRYDFLILSRMIGKKGGRIVVIGDSYFATNKNLEDENQPDRRNVRHMNNIKFWNWLLHKLDSKSHLNLPAPKRPAAAEATNRTGNQP